MTDNSSLPVASGNETFANHDIGGVKYPRVRLTWGPAGVTNDADVAAGKGVPIQGAVTVTTLPAITGSVTVSSGTVNVGTVTTLPALPAGTAHIGEVKIDPTQLSNPGPLTSAASASVVLATDFGVPLATDKMFAGTTSLTPIFAPIAVSASGDNSIVPLVAAKKLRVLALKITANGAVNAKWRSAANDKTGLSYFAAAGDGEVLPFNPLGWFETNAGEALQVNLSAAVAVGGHLTYVAV